MCITFSILKTLFTTDLNRSFLPSLVWNETTSWRILLIQTEREPKWFSLNSTGSKNGLKDRNLSLVGITTVTTFSTKNTEKGDICTDEVRSDPFSPPVPKPERCSTRRQVYTNHSYTFTSRPYSAFRKCLTLDIIGRGLLRNVLSRCRFPFLYIFPTKNLDDVVLYMKLSIHLSHLYQNPSVLRPVGDDNILPVRGCSSTRPRTPTL